MQRLVEDLVGYVRAVELSGVDVVDAGIDSTPHHIQRLWRLSGGPKAPGPGSHGPKPIRWTGRPARRTGPMGTAPILAPPFATCQTSSSTIVMGRHRSPAWTRNAGVSTGRTPRRAARNRCRLDLPTPVHSQENCATRWLVAGRTRACAPDRQEQKGGEAVEFRMDPGAPAKDTGAADGA